MTAPSPTSTDNPVSSPAGSNAGSEELPTSTTMPMGTDETPSDPSRDERTEGGEQVGTQEEGSSFAPEPRDLWVDELHSLTVLELHERFAQLRMRANPEKTRHYLVCDLLRAYHSAGFRL